MVTRIEPLMPFCVTNSVAKLRASKTDNNLLLLKTDVSAGHFSQSDRYKVSKLSPFS